MSEFAQCVIIHESCGGVVDADGGSGDCTECGETVSKDSFVPVQEKRDLDAETVQSLPLDKRSTLRWDQMQSWTRNQSRLKAEVLGYE